MLNELQGLVSYRAEAIAVRVTDPTTRGTAESADFLLLQALNWAEPPLRHAVAQAGRLHPEAFYGFCRALAGEIAIFTSASKRAPRFPESRHDDLAASFAAVFADLRGRPLGDAGADRGADRAVGAPPQGAGGRDRRPCAATRGELRAGGAGQHAGGDAAPATAQPDQDRPGRADRAARQRGAARHRRAPAGGGAAATALPEGTVYFELDTTNLLWRELEHSGAVAVHVAGDFPDLQLELWAIKG